MNLTDYTNHVRYFFFANWGILSEFSAFRTARRGFLDYQEKQRGVEENANILMNGGSKYALKRRRPKNKNKKKKKEEEDAKSLRYNFNQNNMYCGFINRCLNRDDIPKRRKASKVDFDNQGKMPMIVFGNGVINQAMAFKRHLAAPIKKTI